MIDRLIERGAPEDSAGDPQLRLISITLDTSSHVLPGIQEKNINAISVKVAEKVVKEQNRSRVCLADRRACVSFCS